VKNYIIAFLCLCVCATPFLVKPADAGSCTEDFLMHLLRCELPKHIDLKIVLELYNKDKHFTSECLRSFDEILFLATRTAGGPSLQRSTLAAQCLVMVLAQKSSGLIAQALSQKIDLLLNPDCDKRMFFTYWRWAGRIFLIMYKVDEVGFKKPLEYCIDFAVDILGRDVKSEYYRLVCDFLLYCFTSHQMVFQRIIKHLSWSNRLTLAGHFLGKQVDAEFIAALLK